MALSHATDARDRVPVDALDLSRCKRIRGKEDGRDSRTLALFEAVDEEARNPGDARATFPSSEPAKEIDFVLHSRGPFWGAGAAEIIDDPVASGHRPVLARIRVRE